MLQVNIALFAFNLLPAYPLDGGRVLADALLLGGMAREPAARITAVTAFVLGTAVALLGAWQLNWLMIAVALFMLRSTWQLWQAIQAGAVDSHPMFCFDGASAISGAGGSAGTSRSSSSSGGSVRGRQRASGSRLQQQLESHVACLSGRWWQTFGRGDDAGAC